MTEFFSSTHRPCPWIVVVAFFFLTSCSLSPCQAAKTLNDVQILLTHTFDVWQLACFVTPKDNKSSRQAAAAAEADECCLAISVLYPEMLNVLQDITLFPRTKRTIQSICKEGLTTVPKFPVTTFEEEEEEEDGTSPKTTSSPSWWADYFLVIYAGHKYPPHNDPITVRQFHYNLQTSQILEPPEKSPSPLILPAAAAGKNMTLLTSSSLKTTSHVSPQGGMHRLVQTSIENKHKKIRSSDISTFVVWTIPQEIFVDLEQFVVDQVTLDDGTVLEYTVHTSQICDIEQPAFDSPAHVILLELLHHSDSKTPVTTTTAIQTRIHSRYPAPGIDKLDWMEPHTFVVVARQQVGDDNKENDDEPRISIVGSTPSNTLYKVHSWKVATGNPDDYDFVQWITVASCIVGVIWMLRDISRVSKWDNP